MIRAGEVSGQIDDILIRLAEYMEQSLKVKRDIEKAGISAQEKVQEAAAS